MTGTWHPATHQTQLHQPGQLHSSRPTLQAQIRLEVGMPYIPPPDKSVQGLSRFRTYVSLNYLRIGTHNDIKPFTQAQGIQRLDHVVNLLQTDIQHEVDELEQTTLCELASSVVVTTSGLVRFLQPDIVARTVFSQARGYPNYLVEKLKQPPRLIRASWLDWLNFQSTLLDSVTVACNSIFMYLVSCNKAGG